jgi:hypothetical protein
MNSISIPGVVLPKASSTSFVNFWMFVPNEVVIEVPNILGYMSAFAILLGEEFPVKKLAKYTAKKGFMLNSEDFFNFLVFEIWFMAIIFLNHSFALSRIYKLISSDISSIDRVAILYHVNDRY